MQQLITAVVRPAKVQDICEALQSLGFRGFTVTMVTGYGKVRGHAELYRGLEYPAEFRDQAKLEIVTGDHDVQLVVDMICAAAVTGGLGDGKIWVTPVSLLVRIRTREAGADAL